MAAETPLQKDKMTTVYNAQNTTVFRTTAANTESEQPHLRASLAKTSVVLAAAASAASSAAAAAVLAAVFRVASNLWMADASTVGLLLPE